MRLCPINLLEESHFRFNLRNKLAIKSPYRFYISEYLRPSLVDPDKVCHFNKSLKLITPGINHRLIPLDIKSRPKPKDFHTQPQFLLSLHLLSTLSSPNSQVLNFIFTKWGDSLSFWLWFVALALRLGNILQLLFSTLMQTVVGLSSQFPPTTTFQTCTNLVLITVPNLPDSVERKLPCSF